MSELAPSVGRRIVAGAALGLVVMAGAAPSFGEWLRGEEVRSLESCQAYEGEHPETKSQMVAVGSVPKEVLAACGLSSYIEGPSPYSYSSDNDPEMATTLGREVDYSGALVRLPESTRLENRLASLKNVNELIIIMGGMGAVLGGIVSFLWAARPRTRIKIS